MRDLLRQLEDAEAHVARLRTAISGSTCAELGKHDWKHIGGRNAGCSEECNCSVPVHQCVRCGDFDYGDNPEAMDKIAQCKAEVQP